MTTVQDISALQAGWSFITIAKGGIHPTLLGTIWAENYAKWMQYLKWSLLQYYTVLVRPAVTRTLTKYFCSSHRHGLCRMEGVQDTIEAYAGSSPSSLISKESLFST
jgi:hypothetical protein